MKQIKHVWLLFTLIVCPLFMVSCGQSGPAEQPAALTSEQPAGSPDDKPADDAAKAKQSPSGTQAAGTTALYLDIGDERIALTLYDTPAARDLLTLLPLELSFTDYHGTEKISDLPRSLNTQGEPEGFDPSAGDFTLYAPWGNLAFFYRDFDYSPGLISLGYIDSGMQALENQTGDFTAVLTLAPPAQP